ncbi:MAG: hypothetical protein KDA99_11580, partial [Planctomycetales bacterium]|nr:hypothetical protein [Planctomycetales bacterium]
AEAAAARLADAPDDENTPRWQFDDLPARCALEADQVDKYMEESDDPDDSLKQLVSVLIDQGKFTRAREVIASCGPRCREPATMPELTLRIAMADNDDAALIAACEGMGDTIWKTDVYGNWSIANAKYACLAACLRQGRREEAGTIAERLRSESKRSGAIAAVMMNDFATAETILSDEDMNQQSLTYYSENVNVLWRQASSTEAGKSLRGKFPPTWNSRSDEIVLLFFDNTAAWLNQLEASALQQSLSEAFGPGVEVFDTPTDNDAPQRNGKWRRSFFNDDFQGVVECVPWTDIRVDDTSLVDILRRRPSITRVLVCTVYDDRQEINLLPPMTRWAQLMSRQGCVAAYVEELSRALLDPVDQLAEIDAGHPYSWYGVGATSYLFPAGMSKHHATNSEWWRVAAESAKRFDELVDGNVSNVQIRCTWDMGISSMDAWMRVVEVRRDSDMCVGEIVDSQAPLPLLSSGTRYLVPLRQIKQWREEP